MLALVHHLLLRGLLNRIVCPWCRDTSTAGVD